MSRQALQRLVPLTCALAVAAGAPAAALGAGGDDAAVRAVVSQYLKAADAGSPSTCRYMTASMQRWTAEMVAGLTQRRIGSCADAMTAMAGIYAKYGARDQAARLLAAELAAVARGKLTITGSTATLKTAYTTGAVKASSVTTLVRVGGRWLIADSSGSSDLDTSRG